MKFSIIVPIYKVEAYLPQCIESILAQSCQDFEVILVDDGSPDGCGRICDQYAAQDPRFRVIHKENGGLSSARNAGLDIAKGKYIYFLDSDDRIAPSLLETLARAMGEGLDMVAFRYQILRNDQLAEPGREILEGEMDLSAPSKKLAFITDTLVPCKIGWEAWSRVFLRDKIEKYGLRFADNRRIFAEDLYFSLCYLAHCEKILCLNECLYYYRVREDSIMGVQQSKSNLGRIHLLAETVLSYYRRFDDCSLLVEHFDEIYYHLMAGQFQFQLWASGMEPKAYRELVREEMQPWEEMEQRLKSYLQSTHGLMRISEYELKTSTLFLLGGSYMMLRLRCRLIRFLKRGQEKKHG